LLAAKLWGGLAVGAGFNLRYDHHPLEGIKELDTQTVLSIIYSYSSAAPAKTECEPCAPPLAPPLAPEPPAAPAPAPTPAAPAPPADPMGSPAATPPEAASAPGAAAPAPATP
jgi:hypothetical protein